MVTIYRQLNWKIAVYGREHGLPHFHIEGPGFRCSIDIETLDVIVGMVPAPVLKEARAWAKVNHTLLQAKWQELNS